MAEKSWHYQRKTNKAIRSDKGKKKPARSNTHVQYVIPAGATRADFLDTIAFVRRLQ